MNGQQGAGQSPSGPAMCDLATLGTVVRMVRRATEDEVVGVFLRAEIDSERHDQRILKELQADGRCRSVVDAPDFQDTGANAYRRSLLGRVRSRGTVGDAGVHVY